MTTTKSTSAFSSLQGEGVRAGTANVFVRFTGCNMKCDVEPGPLSPGGFACDTEFRSGRKVTLAELEGWILDQITISGASNPKWLILTGGEPGLQVDEEFCRYFHSLGYKLAIETNGTICLPYRDNEQGKRVWLIDWITLSPKVAEHAVKQLWANEIKYVRGYGQGIPKPAATAEHKLISPAFDGLRVDQRTLQWCTKLCLENPEWRLSLQTHKFLSIR